MIFIYPIKKKILILQFYFQKCFNPNFILLKKSTNLKKDIYKFTKRNYNQILFKIFFWILSKKNSLLSIYLEKEFLDFMKKEISLPI